MIRCLRKCIPGPVKRIIRKVKYRFFIQTPLRLETSKAKGRRIRERFFEKYCQGKGIDIGYGGDLLSENCQGWDIENGDAQYLKGIKDRTFDFVYSSHLLEHMADPSGALKNWWRVLKEGGYLILYLPHRDLYEKKKTLPSRWNLEHRHYFLIDKDEKPHTIGIIPLIQNSLPDGKIIYAKECRGGHTITAPEIHSDGEYSIEVVIKKNSVNQPEFASQSSTEADS